MLAEPHGVHRLIPPKWWPIILRRLQKALATGKDVVYVGCNTRLSTRQAIVREAYKAGYRVHYIHLETPISICVQNRSAELVRFYLNDYRQPSLAEGVARISTYRYNT